MKYRVIVIAMVSLLALGACQSGEIKALKKEKDDCQAKYEEVLKQVEIEREKAETFAVQLEMTNLRLEELERRLEVYDEANGD
ncbi:MAG: hypothetical protein AAFX87_25510 [Bacteroidota bacterium]